MINTSDVKIWGIHTRDDNLFLKENVIAIGWEEMGDLSKIAADREALKKCHSLIYPNSKKQSAAIGVGIIYKFAHEVKIGDYVVFPSKIDKQINIGIVESDYYYESKAEWYNNRRKVKWIKHLPRTAFSQGALYVLGAQMTFFTVKSYIDEFISALNNDKTYIPDEDDSIGATAAEIKLSTKDFIIKELSKNLKGYDLENFVADLLEAMGYRTNVSQHGGDSGVDIIAYKDELPPRILVQVKSQDGDIRENTIQSLKGAMREGDYGVFVTLSDYTKNARKYLENTPIIRGINGDELTELILKYYNNLSEKYKEIIPLEMVYIPVAFEEEQ